MRARYSTAGGCVRGLRAAPATTSRESRSGLTQDRQQQGGCWPGRALVARPHAAVFSEASGQRGLAGLAVLVQGSMGKAGEGGGMIEFRVKVGSARGRSPSQTPLFGRFGAA